VADSIALFLSCISILLILSGLHRKKKGMMKFVVWSLWSSILSMLVAFNCAFSKVYFYTDHKNSHKNRVANVLLGVLLYVAIYICLIASIIQFARSHKAKSWLRNSWRTEHKTFKWVLEVATYIFYYLIGVGLGMVIIVLTISTTRSV
jgi:Domain of unknown function